MFLIGGVVALTESLALEIAGDNILVNAIAPGPIVPPLSFVRQIPLNRLGKPNDVAGLAVFLASSDSD